MLGNLSYKLPTDRIGGGGGISFSGGAVGDIMIRSGAATIGPMTTTPGLIPIGGGGFFLENIFFNFGIGTGFHGVGVAAPTERLHVGNGNARFDGRVLKTTGAAVASANDLTLGTDGNSFPITGNVTINRIDPTGWTIGSEFKLVLSGTPTIAHNVASGGGFVRILVDGNANYTPANPGSIVTIYYDGTNFYLHPFYTA